VVVSDELRKELILHELDESRASILEAACALSPNKQRQVFLGNWSPADVLAHLIGWDRTNSEAAQELLEGRLPSFYAYIDHDWRAYNALLVRRYERDDFDQLIEDASRSHRDLVNVLTGLPANEIVKDRGIRFRGWKVTIERLIKAEASDEREHAKQLSEFARVITIT
jgi:hypothetical protein